MNDEDWKLPREDYRAIWREFYCAVVAGRQSSLDVAYTTDTVKVYANITDDMMEQYLKRINYFRELNLKAFK